jgi:hypothetical protein
MNDVRGSEVRPGAYRPAPRISAQPAESQKIAPRRHSYALLGAFLALPENRHWYLHAASPAYFTWVKFGLRFPWDTSYLVGLVTAACRKAPSLPRLALERRRTTVVAAGDR